MHLKKTLNLLLQMYIVAFYGLSSFWICGMSFDVSHKAISGKKKKKIPGIKWNIIQRMVNYQFKLCDRKTFKWLPDIHVL